MAIATAEAKIEFLPITPDKRELITRYLRNAEGRGCEVSFANLCFWGEQSYAQIAGHLVLLSRFNDKIYYPYPFGEGDKKAVLDQIIEDSAIRNIPLRITGLTAADVETVDAIYPGRFRFSSNESTFDYVYDINDLAELKGKKYHSKRNHIARFTESVPSYTVELISKANASKVKEMAENWYDLRMDTDAEDYAAERVAIAKALDFYDELGLEGLALMDNGRVLGFTIASRMSSDTFDVHFEKAYADIQGAYAVINRELALYIRKKYPDIKYLDREEDMGIEGLRKAKKSYYPHHMTEKFTAYMEDGYGI